MVCRSKKGSVGQWSQGRASKEVDRYWECGVGGGEMVGEMESIRQQRNIAQCARGCMVWAYCAYVQCTMSIYMYMSSIIMKLMVEGTLYPGYLYQGKTSNSFSLISFRRCLSARSSRIVGQLGTIMSRKCSMAVFVHNKDMSISS